MTRRQLFRLISYVLLGVLLLFLLIVYSLYLSAQRLPDFYKESLAVSPELRQVQNKRMREKIINLNNSVQNTGKPWSIQFSEDDLNAYFAVELAREGSNILPRDITEPRLTFSDRQLDFACRVEQGSLAGILHLMVGLEIPEPNRLSIRIKNARLGKLPISREIPAKMLAEALEKAGYKVRQSTTADDPVVSFMLDLKYGKDLKVNLESLSLVDGAVQISGETEKATGK